MLNINAAAPHEKARGFYSFGICKTCIFRVTKAIIFCNCYGLGYTCKYNGMIRNTCVIFVGKWEIN